MNQLLSIWGALDFQKRVIVLMAVIATVAAVFGVARMVSTPQLSLLYSGLDSASAGEVITQLEAENVPFEVRGPAIYVATDRRDQIRLTLAAKGVPANGAVGYELLDTLTGFGTTSQMFDAAYWRAKEGELARTIVASPDIRSARVHIANPVKQPFSRASNTSASVTVTMGNGTLDNTRARAIRFLVSSAVAGLAAQDVTVIDASAGVILSAGSESPTGLAGAGKPDPRAISLKTNIERLLEARVGQGRVAVEVMIDADMDSQTITERVIDPTSRVAISSDSEERTEQAQGTGSSSVTVASNLPDGDAGGDGSSSSRTNEQLRERLNYEVSETRRERIILPGQIRRITVAVMVDGISATGADGARTWEPRPEDELSALRSLVESAIGFDAARGDVVTLQTLEFPQISGEGTLVSGAQSGLMSSLTSFIPLGVMAIVALVLGLFVIRPILTQPPALPSPDLLEAQNGEILAGSDTTPQHVETQGLIEPDAGKLANLRNVIAQRSDESADVLRRWIEAPEKPTKA